MAKSLSASKKVMENYLSELLTDPDAIEPEQSAYIIQGAVDHDIHHTASTLTAIKENSSLEKLLENVGTPIEQEASTPTTTSLPENLTSPLLSSQDSPVEKSYRQGDFQAMYFNVAGLTIAVPLIELGGIHKIAKITNLMGKPDWFKGVMIHREDKIKVVDTALWVMPEKCDSKLIDDLNYQFIIMLKDSGWSLTAEHLVDTVVLKQEEVKWLDSSNKRPWLAGLVKEKMCALLDVTALINLLDEGNLL